MDHLKRESRVGYESDAEGGGVSEQQSSDDQADGFDVSNSEENTRRNIEYATTHKRDAFHGQLSESGESPVARSSPSRQEATLDQADGRSTSRAPSSWGSDSDAHRQIKEKGDPPHYCLICGGRNREVPKRFRNIRNMPMGRKSSRPNLGFNPT